MPQPKKPKIESLIGKKIVGLEYEQGHICFMGEDGVSMFSARWDDIFDGEFGNHFDVSGLEL